MTPDLLQEESQRLGGAYDSSQCTQDCKYPGRPDPMIRRIRQPHVHPGPLAPTMQHAPTNRLPNTNAVGELGCAGRDVHPSINQEPEDPTLDVSGVSTEVTPVNQESCDHITLRTTTAIREETVEHVLEGDKVVSNNEKTSSPKMSVRFSALSRCDDEARRFGNNSCETPVEEEVDHEEVILTSVKQEPYDPTLDGEETSMGTGEPGKFESNNQETNTAKLPMSGGKGMNKSGKKRDLFSIMARLSTNKTRRLGNGSRTEQFTPINQEAGDDALLGSQVTPVGQETPLPLQQGDSTLDSAVATTSMSSPTSSNNSPNFLWHAENNMAAQIDMNNSSIVPMAQGCTLSMTQECTVNASGSSQWMKILPRPASSQTQDTRSENKSDAVMVYQGQAGIHRGQSDEQSNPEAASGIHGFPYMCVMHLPAQSVTDRAANLKVGDSFSTWEELLAVLDEFQRINKVKLSKTFCTTVEAKNKKLSELAQKYPSAHVYAHIQFGCIHSGKRRSRSTGIRANQWSIKMECPARIYVASDRAKQKLVVKTFNNDHNHDVNEAVKKIPSPAMSREAKYKEALSVCKEIAEVTSLCGDEEYRRRLDMMRFLMKCWKSNKAVQITSTSPTEDKDYTSSGSQHTHTADREVKEAANYLTATQDLHAVSHAPSENGKDNIVRIGGEKRHAECNDKLPKRKKPKDAETSNVLWMSQALSLLPGSK
ncbi:uncharacterized protein [Branchiostoma lanceolatum]|uniref:uncharacterized protein n=1 Tax=Branchiostoma lanceolatum TaxID=7740 RepID=UPI003453516F